MKSSYALLALALLSAPLRAEAPRTLSVTGVGTVQVTPDIASVNYSIVNEGPTTASVSGLIEENKTRVQPTVDYLKRVVGSSGTVTVVPSVSRNFEYDQALNKNVFKGYRVVTSIQVVIEGASNIETNLAKLYDSASIKADETGTPVMSLSQPTRQAATLEAYGLAVKDAVAQAKAQLEPGETLGRALSRGNRAEVPAPSFEMSARAMAPMSADGPGGGSAMVETGKMYVNALSHFIFEVTGDAWRLFQGVN